MTIGVQKNIVRFDVTMDISESVDGVYGQNHFDNVEFGHVLRQSILKLTEEGQEVTATVVVHDKVLQKNGIVILTAFAGGKNWPLARQMPMKADKDGRRE